jgi:hypothetical protein
VFEDGLLRRIFRPKSDEVTGGWRNLHNLYPSLSIIILIKLRTVRRAGNVTLMGDTRNACRFSVGKSEGKRPVGTPRRRWRDMLKWSLREIGWDGMDWIHPA